VKDLWGETHEYEDTPTAKSDKAEPQDTPSAESDKAEPQGKKEEKKVEHKDDKMAIKEAKNSAKSEMESLKKQRKADSKTVIKGNKSQVRHKGPKTVKKDATANSTDNKEDKKDKAKPIKLEKDTPKSKPETPKPVETVSKKQNDAK